MAVFLEAGVVTIAAAFRLAARQRSYCDHHEQVPQPGLGLKTIAAGSFAASPTALGYAGFDCTDVDNCPITPVKMSAAFLMRSESCTGLITLNDVARPRRLLRSIVAVLTGLLAVVILSVGTDAVLYALSLFPPPGQPVRERVLVLATIYRTAYAVTGGYIAARHAPDRPTMHALTLGTLGLLASIVGVVATWNTKPVIGHDWYPPALVALALPPAWAGGRLREQRLRTKSNG
jgi:hypothetical protein